MMLSILFVAVCGYVYFLKNTKWVTLYVFQAVESLLCFGDDG